MKTVAALLIALGVGCGGGAGGTAAGGGGGGGGSGNCTMRLQGDAASGVAAATVACGYPRSFDLNGIVLGPVVASTISNSGVTFTSVPITATYPLSAGKSASFNIVDNPLRLGTYTESSGPAGSHAAPGFSYVQNANTSTLQMWVAAQAFGSFTATLTSTAPTALSDCEQFGLDPAVIQGCSRAHGTLHAVLVPATDTTPANHAAGTVTMDVTF